MPIPLPEQMLELKFCEMLRIKNHETSKMRNLLISVVITSEIATRVNCLTLSECSFGQSFRSDDVDVATL